MAKDVNPIIVSPEAVDRARNIERLAHDQRLCIRNLVCPACGHDLTYPAPLSAVLVCTSEYCNKEFEAQPR